MSKPWDRETSPLTDDLKSGIDAACEKGHEYGVMTDHARDLERRLRHAEKLLDNLVEALGPCDQHDHHGNCQSHFVEYSCRVAAAIAHLKTAKENT